MGVRVDCSCGARRDDAATHRSSQPAPGSSQVDYLLSELSVPEKPELSTGNLYTPLGRLAANASHAVQTERAHA
jgi:hypothetical protein